MVPNISPHAESNREKNTIKIARGNNEENYKFFNEILNNGRIKNYFNSKIFSGATKPFDCIKSRAFL